MKRDGCPIDSKRYGDKCFPNEIPMVGSYLVPSIENRAGCDYVKGSWDPTHGVCLFTDPWDNPKQPWLTAPVKGVYLWWTITPEPDDKYYIYGNISMVADTPGFPHQVGGGLPVEDIEFTEEFETKEDAINAVREDMLQRISDIKEGNTITEWSESPLYHTPEGKPTHHTGRNAIYGPDAEIIRMVYSKVKKPDIPIFNARFPPNIADKKLPPKRKYEYNADYWMNYTWEDKK